VELRHIRYFVAAAEEESFGRAARRLDVSEPALGLQIKDLEREMRVRLFDRSARGVQLTAAGVSFLSDARGMLRSAGEAMERARRAERGETGTLRIGHIPDTPLRGGAGEIIGRRVAAFRTRYPEVDVQTAQHSTPEQWTALREGRIDVGIAYSPPEDAAGLRSEVLHELQVTGVFLPAAHALARKQVLWCRDLNVLPMIKAAHKTNPLVHDKFLREVRARGLEPQLADEHYMSDLTMGLAMVAEGAGWIPTVASLGEALARAPGAISTGVVYRTWADAPIPFALHLLWREDDRSTLVDRFLAVVREARTARDSGSISGKPRNRGGHLARAKHA
jgi:DNA-binding transcriptional LysR family regulator